MHDPMLLLTILSGLLAAGGLFLAVTGLRSRPPRLSDALAQVAGQLDQGTSAESWAEVLGPDKDLTSRLGAWAFTTLRLPLAERTRRVLGLRGRSIGDFFAEKLILTGLGLATPLLGTALLQGLGQLVTPVPVVASVGCAVLGWFWPDISLRRADESVHADAGEALLTWFDLVTLERLANASAAQAMMSAASLSDTPLFSRIRTALDRARLEQRPPWHELQRLSVEMDLPEIGDMADVMRMEEQGAALSGNLRARVRELRDAHLLAEKMAAQQISERMTLWMVIPTMVFGVVFLAPPILKLMGMEG